MFVETQRRRWTTILLAMLLPAALLAACANGKGKVTPTVEPLAAPGVTIIFACYDWLCADFEKLAEEFHELNPGVKVQLVYTDNISMLGGGRRGGDWSEEAVAELAAAADTTQANLDYRDLQTGFFRDLQPFIEADRTFDTDDFYPGTLEAYQWSSGQWTMPGSVFLRFIHYDKDVFDEVGIDYPRPGWTWDDFLDKAKRLTVREGGQVTRYGFVDPSGESLALPMILGQAGPLVDQTADPPRPLLDRPEVAEAVQWYADLVLIHGVTPALPEDLAGYMDLLVLAAGKAAMTTGDALIAVGLEPKDRNLGVVSLPRGKVAINPVGVMGYAMSTGTQHPDESWRWLAFLTRRQIPSLAMLGVLPACRSVAEESGFWENMAEDQVAAYQSALEHPFPQNQMPEIETPLRGAIHAVLRGECSVETALAEAQAQALKALAAGSEAPPERATPVVVATPEPEPSPGESQIIRFVTLSTDLSHYHSLADEFHALHPEITVKVTQPSLSVLGPGFAPQDLFAAGDCVAGYVDLSDPENRALLLNLQPFLEGDEDLPLEDFYPQALSAFRWEGELWGLPAEGNVYLVAYNKTLFEAAGVPYPRASWTLDDFVRAAQSLTSGEGDEKQYGFVSYTTGTVDLNFFLEQQGVELIDYDVDPPLVRFDDPATVEAVQRYADLVLVHGVKPALPINPYQLDIAAFQERASLLSSGRAAMWMLYGTMLRMGLSYLLPEDFEFGFVPLPLSPEGKGYRQISFSGYFISVDAAHPRACWDWLVFLTGRPGEWGGLPARRSIAESEAFRQQVGEELADAYQFAMAHSQDLATQQADEDSRIGLSRYWFYAAYDRIIAGEETETTLAWAQDMAEAFSVCLASREDPESQELLKTCVTEVDPDFPVEIFGGE